MADAVERGGGAAKKLFSPHFPFSIPTSRSYIIYRMRSSKFVAGKSFSPHSYYVVTEAEKLSATSGFLERKCEGTFWKLEKSLQTAAATMLDTLYVAFNPTEIKYSIQWKEIFQQKRYSVWNTSIVKKLASCFLKGVVFCRSLGFSGQIFLQCNVVGIFSERSFIALVG